MSTELTKLDVHNIIKEYLEENLVMNLSESSIPFSNERRIELTLSLEGDVIAEDYIPIGE